MRSPMLTTLEGDAVLAPRAPATPGAVEGHEILELWTIVSALREDSAFPAPLATPALAARLTGVAESRAPAPSRRTWSLLAGWFSGLGFGAKVALGAVAATAAVGATGTAGVLADHVERALHHDPGTSRPTEKPTVRHHPADHRRTHAVPGDSGDRHVAGPALTRRPRAAAGRKHAALPDRHQGGGPAEVHEPSPGQGGNAGGDTSKTGSGPSPGTSHDDGSRGGPGSSSDGTGDDNGPSDHHDSGGGSDGDSGNGDTSVVGGDSSQDSGGDRSSSGSSGSAGSGSGSDSGAHTGSDSGSGSGSGSGSDGTD